MGEENRHCLTFTQYSLQGGYDVLFAHRQYVWTESWSLWCTHQDLIEDFEECTGFYVVVFGSVEDGVLDFVWVVFGLELGDEFGDSFSFIS